MSKRFQECNWLVKLYRYRFYIPIPFKYIWFMYFKKFNVNIDEVDEVNGVLEDSGEIEVIRGDLLWRLLISTSQISMNWFYTTDEVFGKIEKDLLTDDESIENLNKKYGL